MAGTLDLTETPLTLLVSLTRGADFVRKIEATSGTFPSGTVIELVMGDTVWPATVTSTEATWNVDKTEVAALIDTNPESAILRYTQGPVDRIWGIGSVIVYG